MYRVLITDDISAAGVDLLRAASDVSVDIVKRPSPAQLLGVIGQYEAVITRSATPLDAPVFTAAKHLKVAGRAGVGLDNVDVEAATASGVMVMNTPEANTLAATEHTLAMMLALCRDLPAAVSSLKNGEWNRASFMGVQLAGKTLGIIGLGRIGSRVAARAQAFGMTVIAYDPYISEDVAERAKVELLADLYGLIERSDFITLHTPLSDETQGMLGKAELAHLKPGARLVNCARGGLADEASVLEALESGRLAGAAIDVFSAEPPRSELLKRLIARPDVIVTPHLGANTVEAQEDVGIQIARQVLDALRNENYQNAVNLPFFGGAGYKQSLPYLKLADAIGSLQMQLVRGRITQVEIALEGEEMSERGQSLVIALLKGMLAPILKERVNFVNAPRLAAERGISVTQVAPRGTSDYSNLITCRIISSKEQRLIAGTLFSGRAPRIVQMDDYRMDGTPEGRILVMTSRDVPGVIGRVATLLGEHAINIAEWRLGRTAPGGMAMSFINIDDPASDAVLEELRALPPVHDIRQVVL
jgi:D-3-phosphoglycerate dehydrogenase